MIFEVLVEVLMKSQTWDLKLYRSLTCVLMSSIHLLPPSSVDCKESVKVIFQGLQSAGHLMILPPVYAAWIHYILVFRNKIFLTFFYASTALVSLGLLIVEVSRSHSVEILWTRDRPFAETSILQRTSLERDRHPCPCGIRKPNPCKQEAADPRLRPRGHWDRHS
jgi:hypothetical protein